ncbi:MAG: hypothetical protein A3C40_06585 [Burkholderiales bacterium RIFCSPHIGHO2_02_FULL_64_19]|nr:MAG: hypothetical protein A3C40_06585 [Burkholderiales bacterium RIFCSPHIGHO2_02_FULL_64_19]
MSSLRSVSLKHLILLTRAANLICKPVQTDSVICGFRNVAALPARYTRLWNTGPTRYFGLRQSRLAEALQVLPSGAHAAILFDLAYQMQCDFELLTNA